MSTPENKPKPEKVEKPPVYLLLAKVFALILLVLAAMYAVPRVFSLETDFGPLLGLIAAFFAVCGGVFLIGSINKTASRILDFW